MPKLSSFYKIVSPKPMSTTVIDNQEIGGQGSYSNNSWYQRLVQGAAARQTRYSEYDQMDNDVDLARSLDTIAEEMTGVLDAREAPLELVIDRETNPDITTGDVATISAALKSWVAMHKLSTRIFTIARTTAKYGDCFFIRSKISGTWQYCHPKHIVAAIVDQEDITRVLGWQIRNDVKVPNSPYHQPVHQTGAGARDANTDTFAVSDVIRFTLADDTSEAAPFGQSVLRAVYRAQRQKELLEDAIIIYRIQRAPERRAFYIGVGKMPEHRIKGHMEAFKNEIRQRKIPTADGGINQIDSAYSPQQMSEDFFLPVRSDGTGTKIETLPGGQNLGQLEDLDYFQWKVFRGLRIPLSYMREGSDNAIFTDGKAGVAYIQELRFALYIMRLQSHLNETFTHEFRRFTRSLGIRVDPNAYTIALPIPENFGIYRQQMLDSDLLNNFSSASGITYMSKRFAMRRYLNMTDDEIALNERQRREELGLPKEGGVADYPTLYGDSVMSQPTDEPGSNSIVDEPIPAELVAGTGAGSTSDQSQLATG